MNNQNNYGFNQKLRGFYKASVVDGTTKKVVWEQPEWESNLILNQGMNEIYAQSIVDLITYAISGLGSRPNSINSSTSELTQSGTKVYLNVTTGLTSFTASVSTYVSAVQVGDMLKYANNSESMVLTVTDGRNLVVTPSYTFTVGQTFDIWKTSQSGLETEVSRSTSYLGGTDNCGTTTVGNVRTHRRTHDFPLEIAQQSYNEAGVGWGSTPNPLTVFSRFLLSPAVVVDAGYSLRITYDLQTTWEPSTTQYITASIGGWSNTIGSESIQQFLTSTVVTATGASSDDDALLDPYYVRVVGSQDNGIKAFISPSTQSLAAFGSSTNRSLNVSYSDYPASKAAYAGGMPVVGSYYVDKSCLFQTSAGNRTDYRSLGIGNNWTGPANAGTVYCFLLNQSQSKDNTQTLSLTFRTTWTRTLA